MNILKRILITLLVGFMFLPLCVKADEKTYETLNLDEALTQENIEHDFSKYKETDNQAIIYLFRGNGCGYCRKFLTFLNSIIDDYGKYFKVVSYEVWGNKDNAELMEKVAATMNKEAGGVPYIVIGDKVFAGYAESYDEDIKSAIKKLYNTSKDDRYDVMNNLDGKEEKKDESSNFSIIIFNIIFTLAVCTIVVIYENKKRIELENRILLLEGKKLNKNEK